MTIRERINYLESLEQVLEAIDRLIQNEMGLKRDENGDWATDELGNYIYVEPNPEENPSAYGRYCAYQKIKADVEKLANK